MNQNELKRTRIEEYHKHGCNFYGKLVVINYFESMEKDPKWGKFNQGLTFDYIEKATKLVEEKYGKGNFDVLLSIPELVVRLKDVAIVE